MRRLVLVAIMVGFAHGALAADMPDLPVLRGFVNDSPRAIRTNWEGFYVGGQAGYSISDMNFGNTNTGLANSFSVNYANQFLPFALPGWPTLGKSSHNTTGFGGFFGYNAQWDDAVVGVEANYTHADVSGAYVGVPQVSAITNFAGYNYQTISNSSASLTVHDFGTLRVRGGWAAGNFMPYLFGGIALGSGDLSRVVSGQLTQTLVPSQTQSLTAPPPVGPIVQTANLSNHLLYGYSFGAGTEVLLVGGLFARAEYEYIRFTSPVDVSVSTFHGGVGYKF